MKESEFMIESEKANVVGKTYLSAETLELGSQLAKADLTLPTSKRGVAKMLERICKVAGLPAMNPHVMRKIFFTTACNLNINRDIIRVLMFKGLGKDILAYILNRGELRQAWEQITNAIPLEKKNNGTVSLNVDLIAKALARLITRELGKNTPAIDFGISLGKRETPMDTIKRYLET
jgi:hypothetical protein